MTDIAKTGIRISNSTKATPSPAKLYRDFGFVMAVGIGGLFGLFFPWLGDRPFPVGPWYVAGGFAAIGIIAPRLLKPVYHVWLKVGEVLGAINSRIILGIVFFVFVVPMAWVLKLIGRDAMKRSLDKNSTSYRVIRSDAFDIKRMQTPY